MGGTLPADFISWLEVLIGGEKRLLCCEYNSYNYYEYLNDALKRNGLSSTDVAKIKIWSADFPKEHPACGNWVLPSERFAIQYDDHDQQAPGSSSRDMGDKGTVLIKEKNVDSHRNFNMELFNRQDGNWKIRLILSGYSFAANGANGFPDGKSDCAKYKGKEGVKCVGLAYRPAFRQDACGYSIIGSDGRWIDGEYTRVHRDVGVINSMRKWMGLTRLNPASLGLPAQCR
jgi:alpha-amylase